MAKRDKSMRTMKSRFNSKDKKKAHKFMPEDRTKGEIMQEFRNARKGKK